MRLNQKVEQAKGIIRFALTRLTPKRHTDAIKAFISRDFGVLIDDILNKKG